MMTVDICFMGTLMVISRKQVKHPKYAMFSDNFMWYAFSSKKKYQSFLQIIIKFEARLQNTFITLIAHDYMKGIFKKMNQSV